MESLYSTIANGLINLFRKILYIVLLLIYIAINSQTVNLSLEKTPQSPRKIFPAESIVNKNTDVFGAETRFVANIGQYGDTVAGYGRMGKINFGYEGFSMPVLFTPKGIIYIQQQIITPSQEEKEAMQKSGMKPEEIIAKNKITNCFVTMRWIMANSNAEIIAEDVTESYNTYGTFTAIAKTYRRITYKDLYPGIDVEYYFVNNGKKGFEYNIIVKPGADISMVKMEYKGEVNKISLDRRGYLDIKSPLGTIVESSPSGFYAEAKGNTVHVSYSLKKNVVSFITPSNYDKKNILIIDPFITATTNLAGTNAGKAKDVDFDYAGNVFITGGGDLSNHKLAKYNAAGILQWTYSGVQAVPSWTFGPYYGGWVIEKISGKAYLGQGFDFTTGFIIIRINTAGLYDNYITTGNPSFREDWKMIWNCNNGTPEILIAGGGTNSNINLGICNPTSTTITASNITNIAATAFQDMADMVIDPVTHSMYIIYASGSVPSLNNSIYKNDAPYSNTSIAWHVVSGYTPLQEANNRPYLSNTLIDNSINALAVNSSYLFYWDGKNLKAFNKATGTGVGTPLTISTNLNLMQGGIIADNCNNVFIGSTNGTIKVYKFTGSVFDDAADADISLTGFSTKSIYDLAYNETQRILYACGDGFVSSFDVSSYACSNTTYTLTTNPSCANASVSTLITPTPPTGSIVTYVLYIGNQQVASNTTGIFTSLVPGTNYTIIATVNVVCSGVQTSIGFNLPGPILNTSFTNTGCGNNTGTITATGSAGVSPYTYSIDGINFSGNGSFTSLAGGIYTVTVKDSNGCKTSAPVNIHNSNGPTVIFTKTDATCGNTTGTITASGTGSNAPLQYSIDGTTYHNSSFFTGLAPGTYTLSVKDSAGCTNAILVTINSGPASTLTASSIPATCGNSNGSITAFGSGGTAPLRYSINGNTFQSGNTFTGLTPGTYTVTMQDSNGCVKTTAITIANAPGPNATATSTSAQCNNINGSITVAITGGTAPFQYSINGTTFQTLPIFTGLAAGSYTITVKDANLCTATVSIIVSNTGAPSITATSSASSCSSNTGTITASGSGGTAPLTYSINGSTYQASSLFTGLAPGNYVVLVKDINGCINAYPIVVASSTAPSVTASTTPSACNSNNGIITATGSGGTAPLRYSIDGTTFQSANVFTGLPPGTYTLTVKDNNACVSSISVFLNNAVGLSLSASSISTNCNVANGGSITAAATGNDPPFTYSINGTTYQSGTVFNGLGAGNYTVYVKDSSGCVITKTITVGTSLAPHVIATATNANCAANNGFIKATGSGGTGTLAYSINGTTFQSSTTFINVAPGTYAVTVKDTNGCTGTTSVTLINVGTGPAPGITVTKLKNSFCGNNRGVIHVSGSGSGGGFTYSINGSAFSGGSSFNFLSPGGYTITVKDSRGCTASVNVSVIDVPGATVTATATSTPCGSSTGTITATGSGGSTPYLFSLNGGITNQASGTFTGLSAGVYTVTITDNEACTNITNVTVLNTGGPSISASKTDGTCDYNDGKISATGTGGTGTLSYSIDGINFQVSGVFTALAAGTYLVSVKDSTGCINGTSITINNIGAPSITVTIYGATCGLNNGRLNATGSGGTPPLRYSIDGLNFQSTASIVGLSPGAYTVYVKDSIGCYQAQSVTVPNLPLPQVTAYAVPASCNTSNGSIVATGTGSNIPFQYSINGITFQSSSIFPGLAAGSYTITIKDSSGCTNTTAITLGNIGGPQLVASTTSSTCGASNGSITASASGGSGTLAYSIDGITFQASNIFKGLASGMYTITVKDANGCLNSDQVLVSNITGPQQLTATVVNSTCSLSNGSITVSAIGGVAPRKYSINGINFQLSPIFTGLAPGTYTMTVRDSDSCSITLSVVVQDLSGPLLSAAATNASCNNNDGTITASATGGTVPLSYSIDSVNYQASNIFINLAPGYYSVWVKDANNCRSTSVVTMNSSAQPTITASGYNVCKTDPPVVLTSTPGGNGSRYFLDGTEFFTSTIDPAVTDTGWHIVRYSYTNPLTKCSKDTSLKFHVEMPPHVSIDPIGGLCEQKTIDSGVVIKGHTQAPYGFQWINIGGGTVKNSNWTDSVITYVPTIAERAAGKMSIVLVSTGNTNCKRDSAYAEAPIYPTPVVGFNSPKLTGCMPFTTNFVDTDVARDNASYLWDFGDPASGTLNNDTNRNPTHSFNAAGIYTITLRVVSKDGCDAVSTRSQMIEVNPIPKAEFTFEPNAPDWATVTLPKYKFTDRTDNNGFVIKSWNWNFGDGIGTSTLQNPEYNYKIIDPAVDTGWRTVTLKVISEMGDCFDEVKHDIYIGPDLTVFIPNAFSPDVILPLDNKKFRVVATAIKTFEISIFDRWGEEIYNSTNYIEHGWDGTFKSMPVQMDVYIYKVIVTGYDDKIYEYNGTIHLIR
jgi:gliding motility-associated-like protein